MTIQERARNGSETPATGAAASFSLRDWLARLDATGRLAIARPSVKLKFELAGIANRLDGVKATLFPNPGGHSIQVVSGLMSDRAWMAEALGVEEENLLTTFQRSVAAPLPWTETNAAPCQTVVHTSFDLQSLLPIPTHNEHDSGPYITAGLLIVRNPATGIQNVSIHRLQLSGPDMLGVLLLPRHTLAIQRAAEEAGRDLDVAIVIGASPAALLASQAILPLDRDELEVAGALLGKPVEVVKCRGSDIRVPAECEIVIEGRLLANRRAPEGPFGEFPQYYGERAERHVIKVDRVTHRRQPIFHTIVGGGLEHLLLGGIPREATILSFLRLNFPCVVDVELSRGGVCRYHLYVRIRKTAEGEAKNVIMGAFAAHYDIKLVVVVDEDVDIHDPGEVEWAIATRFQADRDLVAVHGTQGSKLDPSTIDGIGSKLGFDATAPLNLPELKFKRIRVPGQETIVLDEVIDDTIRLNDVLGT